MPVLFEFIALKASLLILNISSPFVKTLGFFRLCLESMLQCPWFMLELEQDQGQEPLELLALPEQLAQEVLVVVAAAAVSVSRLPSFSFVPRLAWRNIP